GPSDVYCVKGKEDWVKALDYFCVSAHHSHFDRPLLQAGDRDHRCAIDDNGGGAAWQRQPHIAPLPAHIKEGGAPGQNRSGRINNANVEIHRALRQVRIHLDAPCVRGYSDPLLPRRTGDPIGTERTGHAVVVISGCKERGEYGNRDYGGSNGVEKLRT